MLMYILLAFSGSSPRMRGTPEKKERLLESEGIIPAYAGNTSGNGITTNFLRDHPRVCGEHATVDVTPTDNTGSSPRMRGTPSSSLSSTMSGGIIPAYAGNTLGDGVGDSLGGDHPRVCGEHSAFIGTGTPPSGSSPRMRGTRRWSPKWMVLHGIIPAYAGNTAGMAITSRLRWDHPRVCGEHIYPLSVRKG